MDDSFHLLAHQGLHFTFFLERDFEDQFVVDLENHAGLQIALGQLTIDGNHGELDEIGGRTLQRRVDGGALGKSALVGVAAFHVGNGPHAAEERAH